ncbi:MAG: VCBS repeat-containing protein, partial [Anaerolineae bacterium]|nr:VCBS repeat-containing protein [Anaerolineae bacterium]
SGEDGSVQWKVDPPGDRAWPGVVVADIDGNGDLEVVTAHGGGYVYVFDHTGASVWSQRPITSELRGLTVYDLDGDGKMEIVVTGAWSNKLNTWIYHYDGTSFPGWPQLSNDSGYAAGVYNANAAVGDLDGDQLAEIVVPSDVHYICAYEPNGSQIPANAMYGGKGWGKVGIWESLATELRGWGYCDGVRAESYRTNFADGAADVVDVNNDGMLEVVVTGNVYDCHAGYPPSRYNGVYILNADRSRFNQGGYDWQTVPVDTGAPLSENYSVIESVLPNPAVADLDGDGNKEIVYSSYDGRVHAFWLDKTEHGPWPYSVYNAAEGFYRFASEPAIADLDNDGKAEVIVASWTQKGSNRTGKLHILSDTGVALREIDLPAAIGANWNGALAAPTLANIDADANLEIVLNTAHSGLVAYELPGITNARILWGTGRGNYQRTGAILHGTLCGSTKTMHPLLPGAGDVVTTTIVLRNPGPTLYGIRLTDTLPSQVHFAGGWNVSGGSYGQAGGVITWTGNVSAAVPVNIVFLVTVDSGITTPQVIGNVVKINDGLGSVLERQAVVIANGYGVYLPLVLRGYGP